MLKEMYCGVERDQLPVIHEGFRLNDVMIGIHTTGFSVPDK
jgi:hypothetical protein